LLADLSSSLTCAHARIVVSRSADLTETLEWVGRYFYSEDELEERREALRLGKQQVPHQQTEPADTCGLCSSSEAKAVAAQSHREQQEHQRRLLHNEKQEALAQLDRDEDAAAAAEYGELADA
jgi:nucleosome binding factor SPN SPT16 subunit